MIQSPVATSPQTPMQQQQREKHSTLRFIVLGHGVLSILLLLCLVAISIYALVATDKVKTPKGEKEVPDEFKWFLAIVVAAFSCCYIIYCLVVPVIGSFTDNKGFFLVHTICSFLLVLYAFEEVLRLGYITATKSPSETTLILNISQIVIWIIEGIASVAGGIASMLLFQKMGEAERTQASAVYVIGGSQPQQTSPYPYPQAVNGVPVHQNYY